MNEILGYIDEHRSIRTIPLNLDVDSSIFTDPISIQDDNKAAVDWSKKASIPLPMGLRLLKSDCIPANDAKLDPDLKLMQSRYRTLVGTFIFISYTVRPDIAYATQLLCRSM